MIVKEMKNQRLDDIKAGVETQQEVGEKVEGEKKNTKVGLKFPCSHLSSFPRLRAICQTPKFDRFPCQISYFLQILT